MTLSTNEQILIEQRISNDAKSMFAAYLLWFFLGGFGIHRFYLGRGGSGALMCFMCIAGIVTYLVVIGIFLLIFVGIWWLIDIFLIPGMISKQKGDIRARLTAEALARQSPIETRSEDIVR
ncbi:TM2 domain-containing protein [Phyllobacterium sp. YR620]|uniref:TM2 domain-containing protein n=1 Tax=Phyllobacterium sp. YR620 TaxID=1881066 RepID=UPI000B875F06|nr:TM2 domain-containing protein [Phyllobacterium sp. YR620]